MCRTSQLRLRQLLQHGGAARESSAPAGRKLRRLFPSLRIAVQELDRLRDCAILFPRGGPAHLLVKQLEPQIPNPFRISPSQYLFIFLKLIGRAACFHFRHHLLKHPLTALQLAAQRARILVFKQLLPQLRPLLRRYGLLQLRDIGQVTLWESEDLSLQRLQPGLLRAGNARRDRDGLQPDRSDAKGAHLRGKGLTSQTQKPPHGCSSIASGWWFVLYSCVVVSFSIPQV